MLKNNFIINSEQAKCQCLNAINDLDVSKNYEVCIIMDEKDKTKQQCAFFYKLLHVFVKVNQNSGLDGIYNETEGWWKYKIKVYAKFFDTKKGCLFEKERSKQINEALNTLPDDIKKDIVNAMTMNVKSISNANLDELRILIDNLIILILYYQTPDNILSDEFLSKIIVRKYNSIMRADNVMTKEDYLIQDLCETKFYIENNDSNVYYLYSK